MTVPANSLQRIWSARSRSPRLTGRGQSGSVNAPEPQETVVSQEVVSQANGRTLWVLDKFLELTEIMRRSAPTVVVIALRMLR